MNKILKIFLMILLVVTLIPHIKTAANSDFSVGNKDISRNFSLSDGHLKTISIVNNRLNSQIIPLETSNDFAIKVFKDSDVNMEEVLPKIELDRSLFSAKVVDADNKEKDGAPLFDGNLATIVDFYDGNKQKFQYDVIVDLGANVTVGSFAYQKRPGFSDANYGINGTIGKFQLFVSEDGTSWKNAGEGEFKREDYALYSKDGLHNIGKIVRANFDQIYTTRYVKIRQLSGALSNDVSFTGAELYFYSDQYQKATSLKTEKEILSSELIVKNINDFSKSGFSGKQIIFEPYQFLDSIAYIEYYVLAKDNDYLKSYVTIKIDDENYRIDYIDLDRFVLSPEVEGKWSHPPVNKISSMWIRPYELVLGQPIYAAGMYFGSEFPASDNTLLNNDSLMQIRYYSGKSFKLLKSQNRLNNDGYFVSYPTVMGAADGYSSDVVQTSFFKYIDQIATKTVFRKQYNSWYDNMMDITDESISKSFFEVEEKLNANGILPLDAYVVDDGWNAYNSVNKEGKVTNSPYPNRTAFWEFNDKFPNELYPATELAKKFQSNFGLWLGPQGGYNYFSGFAKYLEKMGTGHATTDYWTNVDPGSPVYIKNLTKLFLDYQKRFDIDYWKLDGFAIRPSSDNDNGHMTGGYNNMYFTSELWENWIETFTTMRQQREKAGKNLFINATCYVNPSPWLLQYVNTIWLQDSGDNGFLKTYGGTQAQQMISYRDNVYFNIFKKNDLQFPLKNVYNHDPIYGVSAGIKFSNEDMRDYLMMNATRGTAFWELYFSPSIFNDDLWEIASDVITWAQNNHNILQHAKLFGTRPDKAGVYGYSSWKDDLGIISFHNSSNQEQTYNLIMDENIGVNSNVNNVEYVQVHPYLDTQQVKSISYKDTLIVTLKPHQTIVYQFNSSNFNKPKLLLAKTISDDTIRLKFDQSIQKPEFENVKEYKLHADTKTLDLVLNDKLQRKTKIKGSIENLFGQIENLNEDVVSYVDGYSVKLIDDDNQIFNSQQKTGGKEVADTNVKLYSFNHEEVVDQGYPILKNLDFGISFQFRATQPTNIIKQENGYQIKLNDNGQIEFKVGNDVITSEYQKTLVKKKAEGKFNSDEYSPTVTYKVSSPSLLDGNVHSVAATREVNGMIKLFVDGQLCNTLFQPKHFLLETGKILVAENNKNLQLGNLEVKTSSLGYKEIVKKDISSSLKPGYSIIDKSNFQAFADSEEKNAGSNEGSAQNVLDSKTGTWWHTSYTNNMTTVPHWITIDTLKPTTIDAYEYVSRNGNGNVKKYQLQISDSNDESSFKTIKEGEMKNGGKTLIELDEPVTARYYRLYITETYGNPQNTFASAAEINVYRKRSGMANFDKLLAAYNNVKAIDLSKYTEESVDHSHIKDLINKIVDTYENPNSTDLDIDNVLAEYNQNWENMKGMLVIKQDQPIEPKPDPKPVPNPDDSNNKPVIPDNNLPFIPNDSNDTYIPIINSDDDLNKILNDTSYVSQKDNGVVVSYRQDAFDSDVELIVKPLGNNKYDIYFIANNKVVQPKYPVLVSLPLNDLNKNTVKVVYINSNNVDFIIPSYIKGDRVYFMTKHFSIYALKDYRLPNTGIK